MYSVLNKLSEFAYFYISKNIASCSFLLVFKTIESLQCIFNDKKNIGMVVKTLQENVSTPKAISISLR